MIGARQDIPRFSRIQFLSLIHGEIKKRIKNKFNVLKALQLYISLQKKYWNITENVNSLLQHCLRKRRFSVVVWYDG